MLKEKLLDHIRERGLIPPGSHVLAACSGGADSVCLLLLLHELSETLQIRLSAVHVHHGLRGASADADAAFVEALCRRLQIPCVIRQADAAAYREKEHLSVEEAARAVRYRAIDETREALGADLVAAAHNLEDQAETVLFHLIRGSGLRGLSGMREKNGVLIRPLLPFSREEIRDELRARGEAWREDETNASDLYTRNVLRNRVFPVLRELRPDAAEKIAETAGALERAEEYLSEEADRWLETHASRPNEGELRFPAEEFASLPLVMQEEVLMQALRTEGFSMKDRTRKHIDDMAALALRPTGKRYLLPGEGALVREYGDMVLRRGGSLEEAPVYAMCCRVFPYVKGMEIPAGTWEKARDFAGKECTKWFDYGKINQMPVLRKRQDGDRFSTRAGTHRKLKDYLIDEKVPREARDRLTVAAAGQEVLWVIGMRMNEAYKVTEDTEEVLEITITGADDEREDQHFDF